MPDLAVLFLLSSAILLAKIKSVFFSFSSSPSVTNLAIDDGGGKYVLVHSFNDLH